MNAKAIAAIVLIVLGILVLAYLGINSTTLGETIDFLGFIGIGRLLEAI